MLLLSLFAIVPAVPADTGPDARIFLVRHAEKQTAGEDPALSEAGRMRAQELADLLQEAGIGHIYSTDFARTRDTAAPLADRLGLAVTIYDWDAMDALAAELTEPGRISLVVGHSDTTPELVRLLGGDPGEPIDEPEEYDRLYVVTVAADGAVTSELRRYGRRWQP
jgi:phosphohistidine phosphatase SixA